MGAEPSLGGSLRGDFSFPLRVRQVPIGFKFFSIRQSRVERYATGARQGDVDEDELVLAVRKNMFAAIPFALIEHFRKYESGLDRVENLAAVKRVVVRIWPAAVEVGDRFPSANLGGDPGRQLIAGAVDRDQ